MSLPRKRKPVLKISVECPLCFTVRDVTKYIVEKPGYTSRCRACSAKIQGELRRKNRDWNRPRGKPRRSLNAPCGEVIVPVQTTEDRSTMKNPYHMVWRGRCSDALDCRLYEDCLQLTANENWPGWRRKEVVCGRGNGVEHRDTCDNLGYVSGLAAHADWVVSNEA